MQLPSLSLLSLLVAAAPLAQACIRVHTEQGYNPLFGDGITVRIFDNNDFFEEQHHQRNGANSESHYTFNFGAGHHVEVWRDGTIGRVWLDNGWNANLVRRDTRFEKECILDSDNGCRLWATSYVSCLDDNFGNCNQYTCGL